MQLSENSLGIQGQNDLGRSKGWIIPCSSAELDRRCQASLCPAGFISATQTNLGSFFLLSHLQLLLVQLCYLMSFLFCMSLCSFDLTSCVVLQHALHRHAGKWLTEVTSDGQLIMHFPQMGAYCFSVAPPTWSTRGRRILTPHWKIHWNI